MKSEQYLPTLLILINTLAGIVYLCQGNIRKTLYFLFAAGLTVTITF